MYLNPQVIRGEGATQTEIALKELIDFIRPSGLSVSPVVNIKETLDVVNAVKKTAPPCWIYGNPVVGLSSGYRPVAINTESIQAAVLILSDVVTVKDAKPIELKTLAPDQQAKILAKLKTANCLGIKSGVTTELVKAENLCGTVIEVMPQKGLGQSYLPTKAAFQWQTDRWVGLITRLQTAQSTTMKKHHGSEQIHMAQLFIAPASKPSWGYGLYVRQDMAVDKVKKVTNQFLTRKNSNDLLSKALDIGETYEFSTPSDAAITQMKSALAIR